MEKNSIEKLKKIKAVIFDGDGILFTGRVFVDKEQGEIMKERSHIDGQGISLLRALGIKIAFVSGEKSGFLERVGEKLNSLPSVTNGKWDKIGIFTGKQGKNKVESIDIWLKDMSIDWSECVAMGDDISDYELLKKSGFAVSPFQAENVIKEISDYTTNREGGNGAIRDLCDLILEAKEMDPIKVKNSNI